MKAIILTFSFILLSFSTFGIEETDVKIKEEFLYRANLIIKFYKESSIINIDNLEEAFRALENIEVTETLLRSNGSIIPNESNHYAWYQDGKLQLKRSWWKSKFEGELENLVKDIIHELLRVTEDYFQDETYNDNGYLLSNKIINERHLNLKRSLYNEECSKRLNLSTELLEVMVKNVRTCNLGRNRTVKDYLDFSQKVSSDCKLNCEKALSYGSLKACQDSYRISLQAASQYEEKCQ